MKDEVAAKHSNCQLCIRYKEYKGQHRSVPGLFCKTHNVFLDWLTDSIAVDVIRLGVDVEPWKTKQPKQKKKKRSTKFKKINNSHRKPINAQ